MGRSLAGSSLCIISNGKNQPVEMISIRRNPASGKIRFPKIAAKRDFWERGAAGAAGKAASAARRPPWRLAGDESAGLRASLNCRFPSGASAKRRGRWPLARANSPRCARPVQVFASFPPAKRAGIHLPFLLVEMIRLELTTYTLRTYRSTG